MHFHRSWLLMMSGQRILGILVRQVLMKVWINFHSGDSGSPGFSSIEQYRLHDGVKDADFSAGAEK